MGSEPPELRVSDEEREHAAEVLRRAAGEGRLTLEELADRLGAAYGAATRGELEPLTADLPQHPVSTRRPQRLSVGVIGGTRLRGRFRAEGTLTTVGLIGGADVDLRETEVVGGELELRCFSLIGGLEVTVPEGVDVEVRRFSLIGGTDVRLGAAPPPGAPVVRITGLGLIGGVDVRTAGERRRLRLPRLPPPPLP